MIIENGKIEPKCKSGGGIDPNTGYAIKPTATWGNPIPCQYFANALNKLAETMQGSNYTAQSYTILIEQQPFSAEQIRLTDRNGNVVGEFSIIQAEPLDAVCQIRIIV